MPRVRDTCSDDEVLVAPVGPFLPEDLAEGPCEIGRDVVFEVVPEKGEGFRYVSSGGKGKGTLELGQDVDEPDGIGVLCQLVAPLGAAVAPEEARFFEAGENLFEVVLRDFVAIRDVTDLDRPCAIGGRELHEGRNPVYRFG